jgi:thermopsin
MPRPFLGLVALVAWILVVSAIGLHPVAATAVPSASTEEAPAGAVLQDPTAGAVTGASFGTTTAAAVQAAPDSSSPLVERALAAERAAGPVDGRLLSLPRPPATAAEQTQAQARGYVSPLYTYAPAPMGIADYGLKSGTGGTVVPYILNTTELQGNFTVGAAGLSAPSYTYFTDPDGYSVQQNAVLTNVTIWGNHTFQYWTQDTIYFNSLLGVGTLVTDTWNFTTATSLVPPSSILAHGPYGSIQPGDELYFTVGPTFPLAYPFTISFTSKSVVNSTHGGEEELEYSAVITRGSTTLYNFADFDYVVFNSTGGGKPPITKASNFTANGFAYNPVGLTDDFELILGGPGGGSQVDLFSVDASLTLDYLNATTSKLESVPSAFNYGGETGETVTGASVSWQSSPGSDSAVMTTGPSILQGLWNATGQEGSEAVTLHVTPANAFVFIAPAAATNFTTTFFEWAPLVDTTTIYLLPGISYEFEAGLSNYDAAEGVSPILDTPQTWTATLTPDPSQGMYTPLWAWSNAQLPSISSGGAGTASDPYILVNDQSAPISNIFGLWNDWTFPIFSGVFLMNTSASVEIVDAAPLTVAMPYSGVPTTNAMPYWFWQVSNVSIVDSYLPGTWWLDLLEVDYIVPPDYAETPAEITFWNSSHNLVADDLIDYTVQGIYLYGGTDNTIWGNTVVAINPPATKITVPTAAPYNGITEAESGDYIYNNAFLDPYSWHPILAFEYQFNDYTGGSEPAERNLDTWNVAPQPASDVAYAFGFPQVPLVGSIANTSWQGGNFWADYGAKNNPYGVLPYTENGSIGNGGDYAPLPPGSLVGNVSAVEFTETGLPIGTSWSVTVDGWEIVSATSEISFFLTDGSYQYTVAGVSGYLATPSAGTPLVTGTAQLVPVTFASSSGTISGTVSPATATVEINGTAVTVTSGAFSESVSVGLHSIVASAPGYATYYNDVSVSGGATTVVPIILARPTTGSGYFAGTVSPDSATLSVDGATQLVTHGTFNITLSVGFHAVEVTATGYLPYVAIVDINAGTTTSQKIVLSANPASSFDYLSPLAYVLIGILAVVAVVCLLIAATRGRRTAPPPPPQSWSQGPPVPPTGATESPPLPAPPTPSAPPPAWSEQPPPGPPPPPPWSET